MTIWIATKCVGILVGAWFCSYLEHIISQYILLSICEKKCIIVNMHRCTLSILEWNINIIIFNMVAKSLNMLCLDWNMYLLGMSINGAWNMIDYVVGVMTWL